jgi:hypothetical protein
MAEAYYKHNCFSINDSYELGPFLEGPIFDQVDRFDTALRHRVWYLSEQQVLSFPPGMFIRSLVVAVRGDVHKEAGTGTTYRSSSGLSKSLRPLLTIRVRHAFQLELRIDVHREEELVDIMKHLSPLYNELLQAEFEVRVTLYEVAAIMLVYPTMLTAFFGRSSEEWKKMVKDHRQGIFGVPWV